MTCQEKNILNNKKNNNCCIFIKWRCNRQETSRLKQDVWGCLLLKRITITAECLPGILNTGMNLQVCHNKDFPKWRLSSMEFQSNCQKMQMLMIDLLASRLLNQITKCFAQKSDQRSYTMDAMQQEQGLEILFEFPPFSLIQREVCKITKEEVNAVILITQAQDIQH